MIPLEPSTGTQDSPFRQARNMLQERLEKTCREEYVFWCKTHKRPVSGKHPMKYSQAVLDMLTLQQQLLAGEITPEDTVAALEQRIDPILNANRIKREGI